MKYEIPCPQCGAINVLDVEGIYFDNELIAEHQKYSCSCCGFVDVGYYRPSRKKIKPEES